VGNRIPRRCAHCGRTYLLLMVFGGGLVRRIRFGCLCHSVPVDPKETDRALQARLRREVVAAAKRPAS
jgi:hypothetical protein